MNPKKLPLVVFLIAAIADLIAVQFDYSWRWISKPIIMISLMIYFVINSSGISNKSKWLFQATLVFALFGDIFLLREDWFVFGLGSFLIMQLGYCIVFSFDLSQRSLRHFIYTIIVGGVIFIQMSYLWPFLDSMRVPVIIYAGSIGAMTILAFARSSDSLGYGYILIGSVLFVVSDTILSLDLFAPEINPPGISVMLTYLIAQFLIVEGYLKYIKSHTSQSATSPSSEKSVGH